MPATIQPLGAQDPLDNTLGAMFLGLVVSAVLYGIAAIQTLYYFTRYPKDALYIKALVTTTLILDTIHLGCITHTIYHYTISNYYDHVQLNIITPTVILEALCTGVTGCLVQGFYTMRVWRLGDTSAFGTKLLVGVIISLILACTGCGTAWVIISLQMKTFQELLSITPLTISINALSAATDVIIAGALVVMLQRSRTGFRGSDSIINKLTLFVVNTGLLTSICAVASLVSLIISPKTLIYASFYFCIGRLYTNSLLASICVRRSIRNGFDDHIANLSMDTPLSPSMLSPISPGDTGPNFVFRQNQIHFAHSQSGGISEIESGFEENSNAQLNNTAGEGGEVKEFEAAERRASMGMGKLAIRIDTRMDEYRDEKETGETEMNDLAVLKSYYQKRQNIP